VTEAETGLTFDTLESLTQDGEFRVKEGFNTIAVDVKTLPENIVEERCRWCR
jgi:hypothetical protein